MSTKKKKNKITSIEQIDPNRHTMLDSKAL